MKSLRLHKTGKIDFLKSLNDKYDKLREKILKNDSISVKEKKTELKMINDKYEKEKNESRSSLF